MKASIVLVTFLLLFFSSFSQNQALIDSLRQNVEKSEGLEKAKALNKLAFRYAFNNFDSALCTIDKSIKLSQFSHYDSIGTEAFNIKGIIYDIKGITDSSEFYFLKTYNLSIEKGISTYKRFSINNLGMMYWRRGDFNKALEYFFQALKLAEDLNIKKFSTIALSNIGLIYQQMGQFEKALDYHKRALALRQEFNTVNDMPASHNNIGVCYKGLNQLDSAIYYYNKAIKYAQITSNSIEECAALSNLGNVYFIKKEYHKSEQYYLKSLNKKGIDSKSVMLNNGSLTSVYYALGQYQNGIKYGLEAEKSLEKNRNYALGYSAYLYLSLNYAAIAKNELALSQISRWEILNDSLFSKDNANAINRLEIAYKTEKKEKELMKEKAEKEKIEKEKYQMQLIVYNKNKWLMAISFLGFLVVAFGLFIMQLNKRKAQKEKDKAIIEEQEKGLIAVISAQEEERKRVAKDLHDGIGQQISAVNLHFQMLSEKIRGMDSNLQVEVDKIKNMISETGVEVRSISHQMMPRALTEFGLIDALEDMIDKSFSNGKIKCNFEHHNMDKRLPQHIEIGLYRIAQELINNILKHAEAKNVEVQLVKKENHCILIVQDNGKGLDPMEKKGIGIQNINSRLQVINGELNLESDSHSGTTAIVRVDLSKAYKNENV